MGWIVGNGLGVPFRRGANFSWSTYWAQRIDLFLFFGETSKIRSGRLYNQMQGATDYMTVTGTAGSYTFQCPNTADYITADIDYIWFKQDITQRTTTEAELVTYDLQRTPTKFDDSSPYLLRWIAILKSGVTLSSTDRDKLFKSFELPILWDNNLNANGHIKGNRTGQNLWTPEWVYPTALLTDGNTWGHFISAETSTITKDASENVSQWNDYLGGGNNLIGGSPDWSVDGILFNGTSDYLRKDAAINQPVTLIALIRQVTWTANDKIWDGWTANKGALAQAVSNPDIYLTSPDPACGNSGFTLNTWKVLTVVLNHENSYIQINDDASTGGDPGDNNMDGLTLGARGGLGSQFSNIQVKDLIVRKEAISAPNLITLKNYLKSRYSISF